MKITEKMDFKLPVNAKIIEVIVGGEESIDPACYAYERCIEDKDLVIKKISKWYHHMPTTMRDFTLMRIKDPAENNTQFEKSCSLSILKFQNYTMDQIQDGEWFRVIYRVSFIKNPEGESSMDRHVWIRNIKGPKLIHVYDNGTFPPVVKVYSVTNPSMIANVKREDRPIILNHEEEMNGLELINPSEEK